MRWLIALVLAVGLSTTAFAADQLPDLKGTWTGPAKAIVFGNNAYHPGTQKPSDPPRVREQSYTFEIEGQDGRVLWGRTFATANPDHWEPLALAILADDKTIVGSDADGSHYLTIVSPDRLERCYTHNGTSPTQSIVASCGFLERVKK
jgi:hypothetical protein